MLILLPLLVAATAASARTITVVNSCDYTIWPAVADARGWEAAPGYSKTVTIPDVWNGRVWPRRGCTFDSSGAGSCIAGNCAAGLNCADATMGWAKLLEVNLGASGFVCPMSVASTESTCTSVTCSTDLNPTCPDDRMKLTDSTGTVVGCLSACMAGINAAVPSINCCSGVYNSHETCLADQVEHYSFFKDGCEHAYAYPMDDQTYLPAVVYTCSSASLPSYTVTFCPGSTTTLKTNVVADDATSDSTESPTSNQLLGMSRPLAFTLLAAFIVLLLALIVVLVCLVRVKKQDKAAAAAAEVEQEAMLSYGHRRGSRRGERGGYRDEEEEEEEKPKRKRSQRSAA
ncbi:hypothetical protein JCM8097_000802 [Rhodosporidiobolus ruineniae]